MLVCAIADHPCSELASKGTFRRKSSGAVWSHELANLACLVFSPESSRVANTKRNEESCPLGQFWRSIRASNDTRKPQGYFWTGRNNIAHTRRPRVGIIALPENRSPLNRLICRFGIVKVFDPKLFKTGHESKGVSISAIFDPKVDAKTVSVSSCIEGQRCDKFRWSSEHYGWAMAGYVDGDNTDDHRSYGRPAMILVVRSVGPVLSAARFFVLPLFFFTRRFFLLPPIKLRCWL